MSGFVGDIEKLALKNQNFRHVLFTGQHSQLVLMSLRPGEEIGSEVHDIVDQFIRIEKGQAKLILGHASHSLKAGSAFVVPAGVSHNVINTSSQNDLKLYTLYSPPHHKDGTIHRTKSDAKLDTSDHI